MTRYRAETMREDHFYKKEGTFDSDLSVIRTKDRIILNANDEYEFVLTLEDAIELRGLLNRFIDSQVVRE